MATATSSVVCDNSSLANFQAWVAAIWSAFGTFGWAQTADTGQSANPPAAVPSSAYVYQIFKAADAAATATPILRKGRMRFQLDAGSSSDHRGIGIGREREHHRAGDRTVHCHGQRILCEPRVGDLQLLLQRGCGKLPGDAVANLGLGLYGLRN